MKVIRKMRRNTIISTVFTCLTLGTLVSCQEEVEDIREGEEEAVITSNSSLVRLIQRSTESNGYKDDFLDHFSCGFVLPPFSVTINGTLIDIQDEDDYQIAFDIINELGNEYEVAFKFPLKIRMNNYAEIQVNNQSQFEGLISECENSNEGDQGIRCLDFQYPVTFYTFNNNSEQIGSISVGMDEEMYLFLADLNANFSASFQYPITVTLSEGDAIRVHNNSELETVLIEARGNCSEN
ncbi:hypothetical protein [Zhouia amylolytica]|uniref:Lipoprotein n=1 Tax=Zhouia amylolytica AD3 TaxID=1286632 RepID=W2US59_9FLAO|nr:hypothetical protein [Zhouia amylolytica]ETN96779.1 hypothetical protein P278_02050 [Zhouia amylolytica AD3]